MTQVQGEKCFRDANRYWGIVSNSLLDAQQDSVGKKCVMVLTHAALSQLFPGDQLASDGDLAACGTSVATTLNCSVVTVDDMSLVGAVFDSLLKIGCVPVLINYEGK